MDTRCVDHDGETILHRACLFGQMDAVMYLTQHHNYLLHSKNNSGRTALHHASNGGNVDIFKHLVTAGLDVHGHNDNMNNMLHYACCDRNHDMIEYLLQHYSDHMIQPKQNVDCYPFHTASWYGEEAILHLFIKHNVDICKLTSEGESILHFSCRFANIATTRFYTCSVPTTSPVEK